MRVSALRKAIALYGVRSSSSCGSHPWEDSIPSEASACGMPRRTTASIGEAAEPSVTLAPMGHCPPTDRADMANSRADVANACGLADQTRPRLKLCSSWSDRPSCCPCPAHGTVSILHMACACAFRAFPLSTCGAQIIDDGVASRSHRKAIFDSSFRVAGGCAGSHCTFGCCVVIELAAAYVDDAGRSAERARTGPPRPAAHSGPVQTQWGRSLGLCSLCHNPILGGSVIETRDGTYHRDCYRCDGCGVDLKGQQVANCNGRPCCLSCAKRGVQVDCSGCGKPIAGTVLRVAGKPWHRQCLDAWGMAASGRRIRMASGSR